MEQPGDWTYCAPFGKQVVRNGRIIYQGPTEALAMAVAQLIENVAADAMAEEREACAAVADTTNCRCLGGAIGINSLCEAHDAARAIRARATSPPSCAQPLSPDPTTGCPGTPAGSTRSR